MRPGTPELTAPHWLGREPGGATCYLVGRACRGERVEVSPSRDWETPTRDYSRPENQDLSHVVVFKKGAKSYSEASIFKDQVCVFARGKGDDWTGFACSKNGTSPLAGVAYKVVSARSCDYRYALICVKGCGRQGSPRTMHYRWSEGGIWDECEQPE